MTKRSAFIPAAIAAFLVATGPAPGAGKSDTLTEGDKAATTDAASESNTWGVACDRDATGTKTGCRITQTVVASETGSRLVMVTVRRTPDKKPASLLVTAPLRTFLVPGALLQVDSKPGWKLPFQLCDDGGCYAGLTADESIIDVLRHGKTLSVEFFDARKRKTVIKLPLKNFGKQFDKAAVTN